jgi:hypothetical protein
VTVSTTGTRAAIGRKTRALELYSDGMPRRRRGISFVRFVSPLCAFLNPRFPIPLLPRSPFDLEGEALCPVLKKESHILIEPHLLSIQKFLSLLLHLCRGIAVSSSAGGAGHLLRLSAAFIHRSR